MIKTWLRKKWIYHKLNKSCSIVRTVDYKNIDYRLWRYPIRERTRRYGVIQRLSRYRLFHNKVYDISRLRLAWNNCITKKRFPIMFSLIGTINIRLVFSIIKSYVFLSPSEQFRFLTLRVSYKHRESHAAVRRHDTNYRDSKNCECLQTKKKKSSLFRNMFVVSGIVRNV